jgi:hypothetical protein
VPPGSSMAGCNDGASPMAHSDDAVVVCTPTNSAVAADQAGTTSKKPMQPRSAIGS